MVSEKLKENIENSENNIWDYIYSKYGELYSTKPSKSSKIFLSLYKDYLKDKEGKTIFIELGCGYGRDLIHIYKNTNFYFYIGIDVSSFVNKMWKYTPDNLLTIKADLLKDTDLYKIKSLLSKYSSYNFVI